MNNTALIRGDEGQLRLEILDYENTQAQTIHDANWLRVAVDVKAGPFSGSIGLALSAVELKTLYLELSRATETLTGSIDFTSMEGNLCLKVDFGRTGVVLMRGVVTPNEPEGNELHFQFHTDPAALEGAVQEFKRLAVQFPAKQSIQM